MLNGAGDRGDGGMAAVARGISWVGVGHVVSQLAWFGSLLFVAALVPPRSFGSVSVAMVVVQVAWLVVGSGTRGAFVVSARVSRGQVRRSVAANAATGLAIGIAAALFANPILRTVAPGADPLVLEVLALSVALYGLSIVPLALLQKEMLFKRHAAANAGAALLASGLAVGAALSGLGVWALVLRQVLFQALLATFAWAGARGLVPAARADDPPARRDPVAWWFFALAVIAFVSLNADYVLVGQFTDVTQVGLYALAFAMAFAPVTQFAWQIGKVLFASAARADDPALVAWRAARAARLTAVVAWPLVAPAVVLAPIVLPRVLGPEWSRMILPFQLLLVAGAVHAVLAVIREFLLGAGHVRACLSVDAAWLAATLVALLVLIPAFGIAGAALAHVALLVPLTCAYVTMAARRLALAPAVLWRTTRLIVLAVAVQAVMTALESTLVRWAGASALVAAAAGAFAGLVALFVLMAGGETPPQKELAGLVRAVRRTSADGLAAARSPVGPLNGAAARRIPRERSDRLTPTGALARRRAVAGLVMAAVAAGTIAVREPHVAAGVLAVGLASLLAFRAPVALLLALLALTAIVPVAVQARLGSGGSVDSAGVLPSDVLLLSGLARALLVLPRQPLRRLSSVAVALTALFLVAAALQMLHALVLRRPMSGVGGEFRALLGFGALFMALPILADPVGRRRLLGGLAWLGLALGLWGIAQFALHLQFDQPEAPISPGTFETAGRMIGMFAFPVAAILAAAVLTGLPSRRPAAQALLFGVLVTNCAAVVLTFERTFVLATLGGFALIFLRGTSRQRGRLALTAVTALACTFVALATASPVALSAYGARLASLTTARSDPAVTYRIEESRLVAQQIRAHPLVGSGLGATILIGRPATTRPLVWRRYAENGYLWLAWKVGLPGAVVLLAALVLAAVAPRNAGEGMAAAILRRGCQAGIAAVGVAGISFGSFTQVGITVLMGVLAAVCLASSPTVMLARPRAAA
jgi:O-antigen/teichoic acid export membrane protein